jgi:hypothetical protein
MDSTAMTRRVSFKFTDVARALKAANAADLPIERLEIYPDGRLVLWRSNGPVPVSSSDDLDRELEEFEACHGQD